MAYWSWYLNAAQLIDKPVEVEDAAGPIELLNAPFGAFFVSCFAVHTHRVPELLMKALHGT